MTSDSLTSGRFWLRVAAACAVLVGVAMIQTPGLMVADTKFDLVGDPARFLGRALHPWDPSSAFGQLQNQAYGYLWPMGPFFLLGSVLDVPGWVVQRLWLALVMCVAFTGTARLSRALGVRSDFACVLAGFAFALSPRMLTTLGPISIEAWPSALAPWVLLPLVIGSTRGSARRAAAWSAIAVAMVGGVNAAATFAVIPLGVVWLLTRTPGPRRRTLMLWWPIFTLLGTLWWLVPLFVLGAYSPPFLDYIETTSVTTFPTTVFDTLRGTSNWVPYVDGSSRAGNDLLTTSYLVLNSAVVLVLGFVGLLDRRTPERRFLVLSVALGVLMVTAGHHGVVTGWWDAQVAELLDEALAPLRNVHKFDPIIRLPLVLGVAFAAQRMLDLPTRDTVQRINRVALVFVAVEVVAAAAMPAALGRMAPARPVLEVPAYWTQAADWLADNTAEDEAALLVPGSGFGDYRWGATRDEPLQWLASTPWAVRNVIPLAPTGNIRMLDRVERAFAQGAGSAGLVSYLRRAGVGYLVVRNDLRPTADVPDPALVHQAIATSPGVRLAATFGPDVAGDPRFETDDGLSVLVNGGWRGHWAAVEIYEVPGSAAPVVSDEPPVVVGGPEDLLDLDGLDVLNGEPAVLATDHDGPPAAGRPLVLTDGLRERERFFPRVHDGASASITPGDVRRNGNPRRDYMLPNQEQWSSTVRLSGAAALSAASSESDSSAPGGVEPGRMPYAAIDASTETSWMSAPGIAHPWWQIDFEAARDLTSVSVAVDPDGADEQRVRVETDQGSTEIVTLPAGDVTRVDLAGAAGSTRRLRVVDASTTGARQLRLAEVRIPGTSVRREVVLPSLPAGWPAPDAVVLRADLDERTGCVEIDADLRCVSDRGRTSEEPERMTRVLTLPNGVSYPVRVQVRSVAGAELDQLVLRDQAVSIVASSTATDDPRAGAIAAFDGDPGTTWLADPDELVPTLSVNLLERTRVRGLRVSTDASDAARAPTRVEVRWPGGRFETRVVDGYARFPRSVLTKHLTVRVLDASALLVTDDVGGTLPVGVGVSELRLVGVPYLPLGLSADDRDLGCGSGPQVQVNGRTYQTAVSASPLDLLQRASIPADLCTGGQAVDELSLPAGESTIIAQANGALQISSIVLGDVADGGDGDPVATTATTADGRTYVVGDGSVLDTKGNVNAGWTAATAGEALDPVVLDGWKQGWSISGPGEVRATFGPDDTYRWGLVGGAAALAVLLAVALLSRRSRRQDAPALTERRLGPLLGIVLGTLTFGLLAGLPGVLIGAGAGAAAAVLGSRRRSDTSSILVAAACLAAGVAYSLRPWANPTGWAGADAWVQYVMLVPLGVLVLTSFDGPRQRAERWGRRNRTPFRRKAGRSTHR